uniref:Uncharacterized protein n=1 Tax=Anguilla anguilla TaxID=7936 RepID=A0A0E9RYS9_ANGAN
MYNKVKTDTWRTAHFGQFCLPKEYNFNEMKKVIDLLYCT